MIFFQTKIPMSSFMVKSFLKKDHGTANFLNCTQEIEKEWILKFQQNEYHLKVSFKEQDYLIKNENDLTNDTLVLHEDENLSEWFKFEVDDSVTLKKLNLNNFFIISNIVSKSVSLKKREKQLDYIIDRFKEINNNILENNSKVGAKNEQKLVQIICNFIIKKSIKLYP
jgi:uncharacterized Rmd1/YagE family protein